MPFIFSTAATTGSGGGGGPSSGLATASLALSDAVLSGGAALQPQSGALPERITTENTYVIQPEAGPVNSLIFGNDDRSIVVVTSNVGRKLDFSGSQVWTAGVLAANGYSLSRISRDIIAVGRISAGSATSFITESNGTVSIRTMPNVASARQCVRVPNATSESTLWINGGSTGSTEFDYITGLATRQLTFPGASNSIYGCSGSFDGIPSLYASFTSGSDSWITRYRESDLTELGRWVFGAAYAVSANPGGNIGTELFVDDNNGTLYVRVGSNIDAIPTAASASANVVAGGAYRAWWAGGPELWGPSAATPGGGAQMHPFMGISSDSRYAACTIQSLNGIISCRGILIRNIQTQRARWTWSMTSGTLHSIRMPGNLNFDIGTQPISGALNDGNLKDYRRARCYYQRATLDGSRVEFNPNKTLNVAMASGQTLTIDVDFNEALGVPQGPKPFIEEGITILYRTP